MELIYIILTSAVITAIINITWNFVDNRIKFKNAKYMQITSYYRELSGNEMKDILDTWISFVIDVDNIHLDDGKVIELLSKTLKYSSPETSKRLAIYQQYNFTKIVNDEMEDFLTQIILVSGIISSLKHDFTGDWVDITDIIKVKITDYNVHESDIIKIISKYGYSNK